MLRILLHDGHLIRTALIHQATTLGIIGRDMENVQWALDHWTITQKLVQCEGPPEDLVTVEQCEKYIGWLESALRVAGSDPAAQRSLDPTL